MKRQVFLAMNQKSKKILFLIPTLKVGGAEHQTIQQVNALHGQGLNIILCLINREVILLNQIQLPRQQVYFLNAKGNTLTFKALLSSLTRIRDLIKICQREKVTHIIANLPLGHWYGRLAKFFGPSVQLLNYHRSLQYEASPLNTLSKKIFNAIQSVLAKKTDDISICISQAVRKNISGYFPLKNPVVLYNSVFDRYTDIAGAIGEVQRQKRIQVVLPGRYHTSKGQLFFLPVCKRLLELFPQQICFRFAGGGPLERQIKDYISGNLLQENIILTGNLPNSELLKEIYKADIIIIPSLHEGLGNVAIESLMLGKTIIASDAGGLKEIVTHGQNGYLFPSGNEEDCISLCRNVLERLPQSLLNSDRLRHDYQKRFSLEAHMIQLRSLLN